MAISIDRRNYLCAGKRRTLELTAQVGKKIKLLLQLLRITGLVGSVGSPRKTGLNLPDPGQLKRHQAEGSLAAVCCGMACCPSR